MVNEYELESTTDVIIIIDGQENQGIGPLKQSPIEYSIHAAISIASHFLKKRDRVGLITYGASNGLLKWIYPESGKKQLYKIIEEIVSIQTYGDFPLNGVIYRAITHMLPARALIIFISSLDQDWTIPKALQDLVSRGFNVIILSPSPVDIEYSLQESASDTSGNGALAHPDTKLLHGSVRTISGKNSARNKHVWPAPYTSGY